MNKWITWNKKIGVKRNGPKMKNYCIYFIDFLDDSDALVNDVASYVFSYIDSTS